MQPLNPLAHSELIPTVHTPEETREMVRKILTDSQQLLVGLTHEQKAQMIGFFVFLLEVEFGPDPNLTKQLVQVFSNVEYNLTYAHQVAAQAERSGMPPLPESSVATDAQVRFENICEKASLRLGMHMLRGVSSFLQEMTHTTEAVQGQISANFPSLG